MLSKSCEHLNLAVNFFWRTQMLANCFSRTNWKGPTFTEEAPSKSRKHWSPSTVVRAAKDGERNILIFSSPHWRLGMKRGWRNMLQNANFQTSYCGWKCNLTSSGDVMIFQIFYLDGGGSGSFADALCRVQKLWEAIIKIFSLKSGRRDCIVMKSLCLMCAQICSREQKNPFLKFQCTKVVRHVVCTCSLSRRLSCSSC